MPNPGLEFSTLSLRTILIALRKVLTHRLQHGTLTLNNRFLGQSPPVYSEKTLPTINLEEKLWQQYRIQPLPSGWRYLKNKGKGASLLLTIAGALIYFIRWSEQSYGELF